MTNGGPLTSRLYVKCPKKPPIMTPMAFPAPKVTSTPVASLDPGSEHEDIPEHSRDMEEEGTAGIMLTCFSIPLCSCKKSFKNVAQKPNGNAPGAA